MPAFEQDAPIPRPSRGPDQMVRALDSATQPGEPQAARALAHRSVAELAIIIPTLNEADNIELLLARLDRALAGIAWEVVFVDDDSTDGTRGCIRAAERRDPRVRALHRIGRRGLASACIEGALATSAPFIAVMDGDLQHD